MDLGLSDAVAIVTASSKGLGLGTAKAMSAEGAKVVLCARDEDWGDEARRRLKWAMLNSPLTKS